MLWIGYRRLGGFLGKFFEHKHWSGNHMPGAPSFPQSRSFGKEKVGSFPLEIIPLTIVRTRNTVVPTLPRKGEG